MTDNKVMFHLYQKLLYFNFLVFFAITLKISKLLKIFNAYKNVHVLITIFSKDNFFFRVVLTDVSEMNTIEEAKKLVESKVGDGGLNLLINNAGINKKVTLETVTPDMMLDTFNINVNGPLFTTKVIK